MSSVISTKDLEERAKRIFNSLGLKDLDIKINSFDSTNGSTSKHVHVDENGAKSEGTESKAGECKFQDTPEKANKRLTETVNNLFKYCTGLIDENSLVGNLKEIFEKRMKDQFGIENDPKTLAKEIDRIASNLFNDPFFKSLKNLGLDIDQEGINEAAKRLRTLWGYDSDPKETKATDPKEEATESKASIIKREIEKKKEEEAKRIKEELEKKEQEKQNRIAVIADNLDKALNARNFDAICNNTAIRVRVSIPTESNYMELEDAAKEGTKQYGFSSSRCSLAPALAEVIFAF